MTSSISIWILATLKLESCLSFISKRVLINSHILSNFNYWSSVWIFSTAKSLNKTESLQKRALRFLYNNYAISYEGLLEKVGKVKMSVYRLRILFVKINKTTKKLNPEFRNKKNKRLVQKKCKILKLLNGIRLLLRQQVWKYMDQRSGTAFLFISNHLKI